MFGGPTWGGTYYGGLLQSLSELAFAISKSVRSIGRGFASSLNSIGFSGSDRSVSVDKDR